MYFTNIANEELQQFHSIVKNNFNISLQDVINNNLFFVEEINNILRIFPLFYTEEIVSSNTNDKILGNRCIICENKENTRLYFIASDENVESIAFSYHCDALGESFWTFHLFDKQNGNVLYNVKSTIRFFSDDELVKEIELYSNKDGIIFFLTTDISFDMMQITFSIADTTQNFEWRRE